MTAPGLKPALYGGERCRHSAVGQVLVEPVHPGQLCAIASLLEQLAPEVALRAWTRRWAAFATAERGMIDVQRRPAG